ncbi:site-specific integrase [Cognatilysobacter bugurensis]|uniref:site-specific integrase n=1 Tax=Cognatilysobacter bugurensis TaxID=543356 RepID=UPI001E4DAE4E|nr:site-specific integrase [Lysobacter bugurensis]
MANLLRALHAYQGQPTTAAALKLAPLLFVRPGNLRAMEWTELDLDAAEWRIPAGKMKMREAHVVPLADQAVAILRELQPLTGRGRYCFPSLRTPDRPMSENTVNAALRRLGFDGETMTGHGFRAMASTRLNEMGWQPDVIERQLAHAERNKVRAAYNRASYKSTCRRIDYYASPAAQAAIEARRAREHPGGVNATNSAVLDAIVCEWARLAGINNQKESEPMTPSAGAGVFRHIRARANDSGGGPELPHPSQARAPANDFDAHAAVGSRLLPPAASTAPVPARMPCGARRHRDGQPCQALSEPGKRRCKWHGRRSTGPRTPEGKARALANLTRARAPEPD